MMSAHVEITHFVVIDSTHAVKQLSTNTCYACPNVLTQNHKVVLTITNA
jgi:hypothetical protein